MAEAAPEQENQQEEVSRETPEEKESLLLDSVKQEEDQTEEQDTISHREDDEVDPDSVEFEKPDYYPEKFWDEEEGLQIEKLVKSYNVLEKQFSMENTKLLKMEIIR